MAQCSKVVQNEADTVKFRQKDPVKCLPDVGIECLRFPFFGENDFQTRLLEKSLFENSFVVPEEDFSPLKLDFCTIYCRSRLNTIILQR